MQFVRRLNRRMVALEKAVAGSLVLAVFAVVLLQVTMRYLFERPNPWSEELSRFCFIGVRLFWNGGFGMSHSGKGSSHLTRLRWRPLTGTTLPSA